MTATALILAALVGALLFGAGATAGALFAWRLSRGLSPAAMPFRRAGGQTNQEKPEAEEKRKYPKVRV